MVGYQTSKSLARVPSVWLCRRYRRVDFTPCVRVSLWGLMFNLFQMRVVLNTFSGVANYAVKPGDTVRRQRCLPVCVWLVVGLDISPSCVDTGSGTIVFMSRAGCFYLNK